MATPHRQSIRLAADLEAVILQGFSVDVEALKYRGSPISSGKSQVLDMKHF